MDEGCAKEEIALFDLSAQRLHHLVVEQRLLDTHHSLGVFSVVFRVAQSPVVPPPILLEQCLLVIDDIVNSLVFHELLDDFGFSVDQQCS